jgi:hypothetical protein
MPEPNMKILPVKEFENSFQANLAKAKLESAGIDCFLTNENAVTLVPNKVGMFSLRIDLMVAEHDFEIATRILNDEEPSNTTERICPNCKSKNIQPNYKYNLAKWLLLIVSLITSSTLISSKHPWVCRDCNTKFAG